MHRSLLLRTSLVLLLAVTTMLTGCSKKDKKVTPPPSAPEVNSLLGTVAIGGTTGALLNTAMPTGTPAAATVAASDSFVAGTNALIVLTVPDSAVALRVGAAGWTGHYLVPITAPALARWRARTEKLAASGVRVLSRTPSHDLANVDIVVTVGVIAGQSTAPLQFVWDGAHSHSQAVTHTMHASQRAAGSGQLQFSLSWSAPVDLDLHVQAPVGADSTDIYYGNDADAGGSLDLDSNAACGLDNVDNENITWGANVPAPGTYKVRVDLWSACEVTSAIPYVVTIRKCNVVVQTINGVALPGEADNGGAFGGKLVGSVTFNGCTGPAAPVAAAPTAPWRHALRAVAVR